MRLMIAAAAMAMTAGIATAQTPPSNAGEVAVTCQAPSPAVCGLATESYINAAGFNRTRRAASAIRAICREVGRDISRASFEAAYLTAIEEIGTNRGARRITQAAVNVTRFATCVDTELVSQVEGSVGNIRSSLERSPS